MENNVNASAEKTQTGKRTVYRPQNSNKFNTNFKLDKRLLWNALNMFVSGLLGGIAFSVGSTVFLSVNNKSVGSALFSLGLMIIFAYGFAFYTSKVGYSLKKSKEQNLMLIPIWLGNFLGALLVGGILTLTRSQISETLYTRANQLCGEKFSDSVGGILILSILCGLLMFIVTDNYKNAKNAAQKYVTLIAVSMVFLLCGFEHFASSTFLFAMANSLNVKALWYIILMTIGNSIGALIIPLSHNGVKLIQTMARK